MVIWPLDGSASGNDAGYRTAFECAADCIFMINRKLEIVEANQACARAFGWPSGMFAPMKLERLISDIVDPAEAGAGSLAELIERDIRDGVLVIAQSFEGCKFRAEMRIAVVRGTRKVSHLVYLREAPADPSFACEPRREAC